MVGILDFLRGAEVQNRLAAAGQPAPSGNALAFWNGGVDEAVANNGDRLVRLPDGSVQRTSAKYGWTEVDRQGGAPSGGGGLLGMMGGPGILPQGGSPAPEPSHPGTITDGRSTPTPSMPQRSGGGIGGFLERLFGADSGPRNSTIQWLVNKGYSPAAAQVIASDKPTLRKVIVESGSPQEASEYQQRAQALQQLGIDVNSSEGRRYFLTGALPSDEAPSMTDDIKEYQYAVRSGQFKGSFPEWQTKSVRTEDPSFGRYMDTRKELAGRPSYKRYTEAIGSYNSMIDASGRDTKAADLNLVYGLAKIMDPTSVVREGEQIMVKNTGALPDWLMGYINQINGGAGLRPDTRKSLMVEAQSRINEYKSAWDLDAQQAQELGREFGLKDNLLIPSVPGMKEFPSFDILPQPTRPTPSVPGKSRVIDGYTIEEVE